MTLSFSIYLILLRTRDLGVPIFKDACRVVLPDPGMQNIYAQCFIEM